MDISQKTTTVNTHLKSKLLFFSQIITTRSCIKNMKFHLISHYGQRGIFRVGREKNELGVLSSQKLPGGLENGLFCPVECTQN